MVAGEDERAVGRRDATAPTEPSLTAGAAATGPSAGTRWARYDVLECLGEGGMGSVHAARDTELDREVALKVLHDELLARASQERLRREARAMARVAHPNVVPVYDVGEHHGRTYYTMERIRGQSVKDWLREPRPWRDVQRVFVDAARGLAAIHAAGLVHRDVKPGNLLLGDDGRARVADLGIALTDPAIPGGAAPLGATTTLHNAGTPAYMAPEQLRGEAGDARSDQFAFGVALFEALDGQRPFTGATVAELLAAMASPPARPRRAPPWLADVVRRALAIDPAARFDDMLALTRALEGPPPRPRRWPWLGLGVAGAAGAAALVVVVRDRPGRAPAASAVAPDAAVAPGLADLPAARDLTALGVEACANRPAFADDRTVVFEHTRGEAVDLYRIPLAGGEPTPIVTTAAWEWSPSPGRRPGEIVHLVLPVDKPFDSSIAYVDVATGVETTAASIVANDVAVVGDTLYYANMTSRELRRFRDGRDDMLATTSGSGAVVAVAASPAGDRVAYVGSDADGGNAICVVTPDGPPAACFAGGLGGSRPAFSPDGRALYYAALTGVVRRDLATGDDTVVVPGRFSGGGIAISPDGATLVYSSCGLATTVVEVTASPQKVLVEGVFPLEPVFGPHGELAWTQRDPAQARRDGHAELVDMLHVRLADGSHLQLTSAALGSVRLASFSASGQVIAFAVESGDSPGLYLVDVEGGAAAVQLTSDARDTGPVWTPDGKIAFTRRGDDGSPRAYLLDTRSGTTTRLGSAARTVAGVDARTGEVLLYGSRLTWLDPATQRERLGPDGVPADAKYVSLSPNGRWLIFQTGATAGDVWRMSLAPAGKPERVYSAPTTLHRAAIDDDGRVAVSVERWAGELHLVPSARGSRF